MDSVEEEESRPWQGVAGTIILLNAYDPLNTKYFDVTHGATCRLIRQYLRASGSHNVGVCVYGVEVTSDASLFGINSVCDIFPLSVPDVSCYGKLEKFDIKTCKQATTLQLSDALWHCSKVFANHKKQLSSRTIILLTRLDVPPHVADQEHTLSRLYDLVDSNVDIKIINVSQEEYKVDKFYEDLSEVIKDFTVPKPIWGVKEIEQIIHQESYRHLAVSKLNFEIGDGFSIGVGIYSLLQRANYSYHKMADLDRETNAPLARVTKTMKVTLKDEETNMDVDGEELKKMPLLKSELLYYHEYGGEKVEFTADEMKQLRNTFGPPGLKLLGFKPASIMCKEKWFLKMGYFLFPNENAIEGSTVAFKALHEACSKLSTVAVCVLCSRVNARPYIVALSPCVKPLGLDVEIGFDVIQIPFVENIREIPIPEGDDTSVTAEHKSFMSDILKKFTINYKPDMFENPKLVSEYRAIEAKVFEDMEQEPFVDTTIQNRDKFEGLNCDLFEQLFGPMGAVAQKRSAPRLQGEIYIDEHELEDRISKRLVHKYTVPQLKQLLGNKAVPTTNLKKDALVEKVYEHYSENF